jgi:hypothetical protein
MRVAIGTTRHLVRFENPGPPIPDGEGGFTEGWTPTTPATWYVSIRRATMRDLERFMAGAVLSTASFLVQGRYHPGVTLQSRMIEADGTIYQVTDKANVQERDVEMDLLCEATAP